jgi:hypothetical protein
MVKVSMLPSAISPAAAQRAMTWRSWEVAARAAARPSGERAAACGPEKRIIAVYRSGRSVAQVR